MDTTKLKEAAAELRAESARCLKLALELDAMIKRAANGSAAEEQPKPSRQRPLFHARKKHSFMTAAVEALREHKGSMHVKDIVPIVTEKRGAPSDRAAVESALGRAMRAGTVKRTAPGTYIAA